MSTTTNGGAGSKQPRKQRAAALAKASLALYGVAEGPVFPAGIAREGDELVMRARRELDLRGRACTLTTEGRLGPRQLGDELLREHEEASLDGPDLALVEKIVAQAAIDMAARLEGNLDTMAGSLVAQVDAVAEASLEEGVGPEPLARVLSQVPRRIAYDQLRPRLAPFFEAVERTLRRALLVRVARLARSGDLVPGCEGARERRGSLTLQLRRDLVLPLGKGVTLSVLVPFPISDDLVSTLAFGNDDDAVRGRLRSEVARFDKALRQEAQAGLRYAAAVLEQAGEGGEGSVDIEVVRSAVEEALERGADMKLHIRRAIQGLSGRMREDKYRLDVQALERHRERYADVGAYYPLARGMARRVVLFVGPTNSGKTYRALNLLTASHRGAYLAPLRLLALEGQAEIEARGRPCSFLTGEERDLREDAPFVSSTIEMLDFRTQLDAVLIDEIQLLADPSRGWAWTAALVGAPASTVILTGSPGCRPAVERICELLGEPLEVIECERLSPLEVMHRPVGLSRITKGTAVVAFSRRDVLDLKTTIEQTTGLSCAVIYGNLSPRVRREEARRFRDGEVGVLVSTDAIAMGLNLPLERVVFFTTVKYDGQRERRLSDQEILQIGGRAGRYGKAEKGEVSALTRESLRDVQAAFSRGPRDTEPPYRVMPDERHVSLLAEVLGTRSLERILVFFGRAVRFESELFTPADLTDLCTLAAVVDKVLPEVELPTRLLLASAPVEVDNERLRGAWQRMLTVFDRGDERKLDDLFQVGRWQRQAKTSDPFELLEAETQLKALTIYAWLAYRFAARFSRLDECEQSRDALSTFIEASLRGRTVRRCVACGGVMPLGFRFSKCDSCHTRRHTRSAEEDAL
jgi:ATP-dependent RNA helicase SUPV3L1/SUV3